MPTTLGLVWHQVLASFHVFRDRTTQICVITSLVMTLIAIVSVPDANPGFLGGVSVLVIGAVAVLSIVTFVASRQPAISPPDSQHRVTAAFTFGVVALTLNLLLSLWSTIILALGLILLAGQAVRTRPNTFPWLMCATLVTLIPWWVWSALDSWDARLLLLLPLAALAYLSGGHIRDAYQRPAEAEPVLSTRGHRLGAWMGMLLGGILIVVAGLIGHSSYAWIALGGIAMAVFVAIEAGISRPDDQPGRYAAAICDGAFVVAAVCWLMGII